MKLDIYDSSYISLGYGNQRAGAGQLIVKSPSTPPGPPPSGDFLGDGSYSILSGPLTCGSLYFNPNVIGSTLQLVQNSGMNLGMGNFTVEWWQNQFGENNSHVRPWNFGSYPGQTLGVSYEGSFYLWRPGAYGVAALGTYKNQWVHFAIVRYNNIMTVYKNGQKLGNEIETIWNFTHNKGLTIGNEFIPNAGSQFGGYITNFHVMKAAKYLTGFNPDTSKPIPPTSATAYLLDCDDQANPTKDYVFANASGSNGDVSWNAANPFGF